MQPAHPNLNPEFQRNDWQDDVSYPQLQTLVANGRVGALKKLINLVPACDLEAALTIAKRFYDDGNVEHRGCTLLGIACVKGQHAALELMLRYLPTPRAIDRACYGDDGITTPLLLAVELADDQLTRMLLDLGADLHAKDAEGQSAIEIARGGMLRSVDGSAWYRCYDKCAQALEKAQRRRLRMRLQRAARRAGRLALALSSWQLRAAERAYAPGGIGFDVASEEFGAHVAACSGGAPAAEATAASSSTLPVEPIVGAAAASQQEEAATTTTCVSPRTAAMAQEPDSPDSVHEVLKHSAPEEATVAKGAPVRVLQRRASSVYYVAASAAIVAAAAAAWARYYARSFAFSPPSSIRRNRL